MEVCDFIPNRRRRACAFRDGRPGFCKPRTFRRVACGAIKAASPTVGMTALGPRALCVSLLHMQKGLETGQTRYTCKEVCVWKERPQCPRSLS